MRLNQLPLLNKIISLLPNNLSSSSDTIIVGVQHLFFSTTMLLKALVSIGIKPEHIFLTGKCYSCSTEVEDEINLLGVQYYRNEKPLVLGEFSSTSHQQLQQLWHEVTQFLHKSDCKIRNIIVLDDGGNANLTIPEYIFQNFRVIGIEQTTSGFANLNLNILPYPIIDVAMSAAKQIIEPKLIADAVIKKIDSLVSSIPTNANVGIVGIGVIGQAMIKRLSKLFDNLFWYDVNENIISTFGQQCFNLEELISKCDYIFGCSGYDITKNLSLDCFYNSTKRLISCSSQDKEFNSLLKTIQLKTHLKYDVFSDINYQPSPETNIIVIKGGYPVNLDNSGESVPHEDIQITRGLLLGAVLQALSILEKKINLDTFSRVMLDPYLQSYIALNWLAIKNLETNKEYFKQIDTIKNLSCGNYLNLTLFMNLTTSQSNVYAAI